MSLRLAAALFSLSVLTGTVAGCAAPSDSETTASAEEDLKIAGAKYVGRIAAGETKTVHYTDPPLYRAFGFEAQGGDTITVTVASEDGDAMAWIASSRYSPLAENDDASESTFDSVVTYTVPTGAPKRSYRLVFRDYSRLDATSNVSLAIQNAATSCDYDNVSYSVGASFPASDGCNTCSCTPSGTAMCTKRACPACNPEAEPKRNYVGTSDTCMLIRYTCQPGWTMFSNACGCGCETN